jgi:hypothetical protein
MVNAGPPADPAMPMRPDPTDPACRAGTWSRCRGLDDVTRSATWILQEGASNFGNDTAWRIDTEALASDEAYSLHPEGARVAALGVYRGPDADETAHILYQWAVMKLYDVPAGFGTGVDRCGIPGQEPIESSCNQGGLAPAPLVDAVLGQPLDPVPAPRDCAPDGWHCVWVRRYRNGIVLVNNAPTERSSGPVTPSDDGSCRRLVDAATGAPTAGGACVRTLDVPLGGFRAEVLRYRTPVPP